MKRIWMIGVVAMMLVGNCFCNSAKADELKDGVLGAFATFAQNRVDNFQVTDKSAVMVKGSYSKQAVRTEWNEEESENAERANEFIYEGETVWLNTEAGYYQSLASIVRDIAYYYNGAYDLDLDLDHPFDKKVE